MNSFINELKKENNFTITENGAVAHKTTLNAVYDLFALGGAYRNRSDDDCILLFKKAFEQDEELALKCLFYLRDVRGGQGERRFFRVCVNWLAKEYPEAAFRNLDNIPEYGRWDDLYCILGTKLENDALDIFAAQLNKDLVSLKESDREGVSLLGKWLKSENASSYETKQLGNRTREYLGYSHKKYRKILSALRTRINIVEKLMSEGQWDKIDFAKIPSKAGLIYRNAFAHNDLTKERYAMFMNDKETKVNANTLYPYEIVNKVTSKIFNDWSSYDFYKLNINEIERRALNKYWDNQKDYLNGEPCKIMCVVDTSGSMTSKDAQKVAPIDVAISLGMYCGERIGEPFKNYFISFSSRPQLIEIEGVDFCDKVKRIYQKNLCDNTNLKAVFDMLKDMYIKGRVKEEDLPEQLIVISDMEIDCNSFWTNRTRMKTEMEMLRNEWASIGLKFPKLYYWNVDARHNNILDDFSNPNVTFVSGCSPVIFESVIKGKTGIQLMLEKLNSERYINIK